MSLTPQTLSGITIMRESGHVAQSLTGIQVEPDKLSVFGGGERACSPVGDRDQQHLSDVRPRAALNLRRCLALTAYETRPLFPVRIGGRSGSFKAVNDARVLSLKSSPD
jgi:hypothetical protein